MISHIQKRQKIFKNLIFISIIAFFITGTMDVEAEDNKNISVQKKIVSLKLGQVANINYTENQNNDIEYYSKNRMVSTIDQKGNII